MMRSADGSAGGRRIGPPPPHPNEDEPGRLSHPVEGLDEQVGALLRGQATDVTDPGRLTAVPEDEKRPW
jgi:hypothetical protein